MIALAFALPHMAHFIMVIELHFFAICHGGDLPPAHGQQYA
jgi:hypothetical protein